MKLYRARRISERPTRHPVFLGNTPAHRVRGRWFTSDLARAEAHGAQITDPWEIVEVDVDDTMAASYCVANTPHTACRLSPIDYTDKAEVDYVIPTWIAMEATMVAGTSAPRQRDYLDVSLPGARSGKVVSVDFTPGMGKSQIPAAI